MSSPAEYYQSLPPISKAYGTLCLLATTAFQFGLINPENIALLYELAIFRFQVWRLITNFFFLGKFSINFGIRLLMIARYGVQLESGPFQRRTADFLWMMIFGALTLLVLSAIPMLWSPFLGISLVFMLLYVWSREFPNANINIYGLVTLKAFYLPWAMLGLDVIFGSPITPDLMGIIAGHLYYFLTVLHPLAGGQNILKTPMWLWLLLLTGDKSSNEVAGAPAGVTDYLRQCIIILLAHIATETCLEINPNMVINSHKVVARWGIGAPTNRPQPDSRTGGVTFRGRSYRVGG